MTLLAAHPLIVLALGLAAVLPSAKFVASHQGKQILRPLRVGKARSASAFGLRMTGFIEAAGPEKSARASRQHAASQGVRAPLAAFQAARQPKPATRTVTDEAGRRVSVPADVTRIVSLAPNDTDILYALGAAEKIAGVTDFSEIPAGEPHVESVGEPVEPSLERIAALQPSLVFVDGSINRWETVYSLEGLGIPVYATDVHTVQGMIRSVREIGAVIGENAAGEALAARLETRLEAVHARLAGHSPKSVFFVVWEDPLITTGRNTFLADALRWAGAKSVVSVSEDWPHISLEEVLAKQPQYLIFPASSAGTPAEIARSLERRAGWRDLKAVKDGHILVVNDAINRPSPPLIGAIEKLARALHPSAFAQPAAGVVPKSARARAQS